jgi:hypothetical protein
LHTTYRVKKLREMFATATERERALEDAPHDSAALAALLGRGVQPGLTSSARDSESRAPILSDEARHTLAWIEALDEE